MTLDTTGLRQWTLDTDALATYHLWLPPEAGEDIARAALDHYMNAGEHEAPFTEEVELPGGAEGRVELVCAAPRRTGRAIIDAAGGDIPYSTGPDDGKHIDGDWEGKPLAHALSAYDTAADLPARLAAARILADTVRAAMIGGTGRPTGSAEGDQAQASALAHELTEAADEFDRAREGGDAEHEAAAALRRTARDAAEYLREVAGLGDGLAEEAAAFARATRSGSSDREHTAAVELAETAAAAAELLTGRPEGT